MEEKNEKNKSPKLEPSNRMSLFIIAGLVGLFLLFNLVSKSGQFSEIAYSEFLSDLQTGKVSDVSIIDMREIQGLRYDAEDRKVGFKTIIPYFDESLLAKLYKYQVNITGAAKGVSIFGLILQFLPMLLLIGFFIWMYRNMHGGDKNVLSFGKSRAKRFEDGNEIITFADIAGQKEAKYELQEVVDFLRSPDKFTQLGAKIPKGVMLMGQPGTGKTLLAKAVAGEAKVPFFHMSGSDFVEMFVGVGASRVRDMFAKARKHAPCILFIDEIDAVGRTRGAGYGGGHDEREQTLNQLLVEMDGFDTDKGVIIIAATNRSDVLDPALLRPGRFDRQIVVALPDVREREAILKIHVAKVTMDDDVDLSVIARGTPGSSGADIANIVNEAALFAGRAARRKIIMDDFEDARDKILMGVARHSMLISDEDKRMTAYHEAGHALLHYFVDKSNPIHKVTIVPRGQALGVTFSFPEDDQYSRSTSSLKAQLVILYGGYAAEVIVYGETSTGAQNDIKQATEIARKMVCDWGMSEPGPIALGGNDQPIFIAREISQHADHSELTAQKIDKGIAKLLFEALEKANKILRRERVRLDILTESLIEKETLNDAEIRSLIKLDENVSDTKGLTQS